MKREYTARMALVFLVLVAVLLIGEACTAEEVAKEKYAASPVVLETESAEVETAFEAVPETSAEATEETYTEPTEAYEEEPVYEEYEAYEPSEELTEDVSEEETEEEPTEEDTEPEEHECGCFYEEYYTEEPGWPCYAHECVDCGQIEYFEYAEDTEEPEEDPEEESECFDE